MAQVIIKIEDAPGGKVKMEMSPNFETMMKMHVSGEEITSAHAYAMHAARSIMEESKKQGPTKFFVPRIGT